jgi:hypothetical protein
MEESMDIGSRAGIDKLGPYRSSNPNWIRAFPALGRQVTKPAVDRGIEKRLPDDLRAGLADGRDNRSVTNPKWVEEGLSKFGCPIHPTGRNSGSAEFTVSGIGICCCRRGERPDNRFSSRRVRRGHGFERVGEARHGRHGRQEHASRRSVTSNGRTAVSSDERRGGAQVSSGPWNTVAYKRGIAAALSIAGGRSSRRKPLPLDQVVENHIDRSKYAGAPFFCSNGDVLDPGLRLARKLWSGGRSFDPYVAGRRVQPGGAGPKTRLVWMAPLPTTIVGTAFSKVVGARMARRRPFCIGLRDVEKAALVSEFKSRFRYIYSIDYSGFDSCVPAKVIDDAFGIAKTHLELTDEDEAVWRRYINDFIHSRLIGPDGLVYRKHKGIPSGSAFTSIIGCLVNLILAQYMWERATGHGIPADRLLILGDDVAIASNTRIDLGELASFAGELGFSLSVEKTEVTDSHRERGVVRMGTHSYDNEVHFLGHYWVNGTPRRPQKELLQRMVYPERHARRSDKESILRMLSYVSDAREGWELFRSVYRLPDGFDAITHALDECSGVNEIVRSIDLPGQLRYRMDVEQGLVEQKELKGLVLGIIARVL